MSIICWLGFCKKTELIWDGLGSWNVKRNIPEQTVFLKVRQCPRCKKQAYEFWRVEERKLWREKHEVQ